MAGIAAPEEKPDAAPVVVVRARRISPQRNALLGIVLASIAISVFVIVVIAAVLFRFAEAGHAVAGM